MKTLLKMLNIFVFTFIFTFSINAEIDYNQKAKQEYKKGNYKAAQKTYLKIVNSIYTKKFSISDKLSYEYENDIFVSDKLANKHFSYESVYFYYKGVYEYSVGEKQKSQKYFEKSIEKFETYFAHVGLWACTGDEKELCKAIDLARALIISPEFLEGVFKPDEFLTGAFPLTFLTKYQYEVVANYDMKMKIKKAISQNYLMLARLSEKYGNSERTGDLYTKAIYSFYDQHEISADVVLQKDMDYLKGIDDESISVYKRMKTEEVKLQGFSSLEEYKEHEYRSSASPLFKYLLWGKSEFYDGIPFKQGDTVYIEDEDSVYFKIIDVQKQDEKWVFLVTCTTNSGHNICCYIISPISSLSGTYYLKYIKDSTYFETTNNEVKEIQTYVFQRQ